MQNTSVQRSVFQWLLILGLLSLFSLSTQAAIPDSLDYQGYLTDSDGSPVNGNVNITFSLYNVGVSGVALWGTTRPVNVSNGLFTVKLGGGGNPFPLGLFDNPLWLGIDVSGDGEMTPRASLSSAAFAHQADNALTLEGSSASSLDQSAHVANISNPHGVSAAQVGAATPVDIEDHAATDNAHHTRYTDAEAVAAMQSHDGSGVNADTLDGSDSAAFARTAHLHNTVYYTQLQVDSLLASLRNEFQTRITLLEEKLAKITVSPNGNQVYITGANLHILSGSGATDAPVNGLGNLIVGYDEAGDGSCSVASIKTQASCEAAGQVWIFGEKSGSHNLVVGSHHSYSDYGGFVAGKGNTISGPYASVSGGAFNVARRAFASVSGGKDNTAWELYSSVSGGRANTASGQYAAVSGGGDNVARAMEASVSGGQNNFATDVGSSVSGGKNNFAAAASSSVSGGESNTAMGVYVSMSGGQNNTASGLYASVSGGQNNTASGLYASVSGGTSNHAFANVGSILGGYSNVAGDPALVDHTIGPESTISGGLSNNTSGLRASISGGQNNTASGSSSSVGGGQYNVASGISSSVTGGGSTNAAFGNLASGNHASVHGGDDNEAYANGSSILGGRRNVTGNIGSGNRSLGVSSTISGGLDNMSTGNAASTSGGRENVSSGEASTVSGGVENTASGDNSTLSGGAVLTEPATAGYRDPGYHFP